MPTQEQVAAAYEALSSGDASRIGEHWSDDLRWCVPGHHQMAGWYEGLDAFLGFMERVGKRSGGSFVMTPITVLVNDEYSCDVTHNTGALLGAPEGTTSPYERLDIDVAHLLRWRDGKVVEGRGAIFGDGTTRFDMFWSQLAPDASRSSDQ